MAVFATFDSDGYSCVVLVALTVANLEILLFDSLFYSSFSSFYRYFEQQIFLKKGLTLYNLLPWALNWWVRFMCDIVLTWHVRKNGPPTSWKAQKLCELSVTRGTKNGLIPRVTLNSFGGFPGFVAVFATFDSDGYSCVVLVALTVANLEILLFDWLFYSSFSSFYRYFKQNSFLKKVPTSRVRKKTVLSHPWRSNMTCKRNGPPPSFMAQNLRPRRISRYSSAIFCLMLQKMFPNLWL